MSEKVILLRKLNVDNGCVGKIATCKAEEGVDGEPSTTDDNAAGRNFDKQPGRYLATGVIYLAGGCFWGTEKGMSCLDGITETEVGYANGNTENPTYEEVCTDTTGFRETVKVCYDSGRVSLERILTAFFIMIDPTVENRQAGDVGSQYQTGVYYSDEADEKVIAAFFEKEKLKHSAFHVELKKLKNFYSAEEYHQKYLDKNPGGYCHVSKKEFDEIKKLNDL